MTDVAFLTATELSARYARGDLSPVEVVRAVLARIERLQPTLNAFAFVDAEAALASARAAETRWHNDTSLSPLDGVPVSIKDLLLTRDQPTRFGSRTSPVQGPWLEDAPAVARLREAGAVLLGKTTTSEFGLKGFGDSPLTGITRNPWHQSHTPGGSSAGAVVATAAGLGAIAIGTDGGGSIRVPSSYTGVVGLVPTFGRVPMHPPSFVGVPARVGPITRSVADSALALAILSRPDARDPLQVPRLDEPRAFSRNLRGLRIGYSATLGYLDVDSEVAAVFERAVNVLREAGASVEPADPDFVDPTPVLRRLFAARAAYSLRDLSEPQWTQLDPVVAASAREGQALSALDLLAAEAQRVALIQHMARYHERFDILVTPASPQPAPRIDQPGQHTQRGSFAAPFSLTRQPALSMPSGLTTSGLPVGLQIVGRHFEDTTVLAVAHAFEHFQPFRAPAC